MKGIVTLIITVGISLLLLSEVSAIGFNSPEAGNITYPTIPIHFLNGKSANITDQIWKDLVFPIFLSKTITTYNWSNDRNLKYVFFDYSLTGLNPFGVQFVLALETYNNISFSTVEDALLYVINLPSQHPGYTNGQLLNMGVLPGFPNSTIPSQNNLPFYFSIQFIVLIILIASVFILYYVFNKYT